MALANNDLPLGQRKPALQGGPVTQGRGMPRQFPASPVLGKVYLIGAGPGAQDLITLRGARLLAQADVVLHDALVTPEMLELCPQALKVAVGKRCGKLSTAQAFINKQMLDYANKYALVVRLKGGDPMMFGRADEELRALEAAGIEVEVVPGITTALAAAAATRQPLTKRGVARSVAFFTSSTAPEHAEHVALPDTDTLVQYMGGREAIVTAQRLLDQGRRADTPVVVIENCSRPDQRIRRLTLATLARGLGEAHGPVLVMLGEALKMREHQASDTEEAEQRLLA
jgi:uroporphyrin-III C-methyltransferase